MIYYKQLIGIKNKDKNKITFFYTMDFFGNLAYGPYLRMFSNMKIKYIETKSILLRVLKILKQVYDIYMCFMH